MTSSAPFHSATIPQERLLPGIHGLRGIAALAVVLFHLVHLANIAAPPAFSFIAGDFGKGVHLFFVLSAFSLMHSTEHTLHRRTWMKEYFVKRYFRIAPLFYCILAGMVLWPSIKAQYLAVSPQALLLNLTFTFGFAPWTGIVWAGWTVGVEMLFYAILPVLLLTIRSSKATLLLLIASILVSHASRTVLQMHFENTVALYKYNWAYFSFAPNVCFFALGMYAFRIAGDAAWDTLAMRRGVSAFTTVLFLALLFLGRYNGWQPDLLLWGFGFAALTVWQSKWPSRWCANRLFEHVGERSYSVYLLHPVVIVLLKSPLQSVYQMLTPSMGHYAYFVCAGLALLPLLLLSEATYRLIEIPAIRYGQRLNARIRTRQDASP
ncbi:MAG: acyltransferase [Rhodocyclales bacterium]|nr:acyltransferase [Rhodocyclales bacterium]